MFRSFVPLGLPPNATKLVGRPASFALAPWAQVLASAKDRSEVVVSPGAHLQPTTLVDADQWILHRSVTFARADASKTAVLAAPRGLYRVDVGYGSQFVCDPAKIVGTLGQINARVVFAESRFDVAKLWTTLLFRSTASELSRAGQAVRRATNFISRHTAPYTAPLMAKLPHIQLPKLSLPPAVRETTAKAAAFTHKWYARAATALFHWTHPKKLQVEGPTSLLIRP